MSLDESEVNSHSEAKVGMTYARLLTCNDAQQPGMLG
jgi:hypothetical protein